MEGTMLAEVPAGDSIRNTEELLDLMAEARYGNAGCVIVHSGSLPDGFLDLKTGMAGEMLQKFSNYRMKLAVIGDFNNVQSKSLRDFIRESNRTGHVRFVATFEEAAEGMLR